MDHYPKGIQHGDVVPARSIYDALYNSGFVAVGTGMLFRPDAGHYAKFIEMLDRKWISDEYLENNIDKERIRMRRIKGKFAVKRPIATKADEGVDSAQSAKPDASLAANVEVDDESKHKSLSPESRMAMKEKNSGRTIGFRNCYSMLDEQSIVFFYFYHKLPWHYLDVQYNFIPWHFKWLQRDDGSNRLEIPSVLHFFGTKPWVQSPVEWRDLQAWWGLVFHLLNYAAAPLPDDEEEKEGAHALPLYPWNETERKLVESFFDLDLMNKLPLEIFVEEQTDFADDEDEIAKRVHSGIRCFWCYELTKRQGLGPDGSIKRGAFKEIEWIFHCPIDPSSGKLCCPKLLGSDSGKEQYDVTEMKVQDDVERQPTRALVHEADEEEDDEMAKYQ